MKTTLVAVFTLLSSAAVSFALDGRSAHGHHHQVSHNKAARHYGRDGTKVKRGGPSKTDRCAAQSSIASVSSVSVASVSTASVASVASVSSVSAFSAWSAWSSASAASVASVAAAASTPPAPAPTDNGNDDNSGSGNSGSGSGSSSGAGGPVYTGGDGTFYSTGLNACGTTDQDTDFIAAAAYGMFDTFPGSNGNSNDNPICQKQVVATYQGKSVTVRITDMCAGCDDACSLDFSPAAFDVLADPSVGRIHGLSYYFVDGSGNPSVTNC